MAGKFEVKTTANGKLMYNLKAGNGQIIITSPMFDSRDALDNAIAGARVAAGNDANFERKVASNGEPFFSLRGPAGENLGRSETYSSNAAMENGINSVKNNAPEANVTEAKEG